MRFSVSTFTRRVTSLLATAAAVVTGACTADDDRTSSPTTLTLVAYDSFVLPEDAFAEFTAATGISVEIALGGDAGEVVSKAVLTAGNPEGDVLWGVDTTLLSRAIDGEVFDPYVAAEPAVPQRLRAAGADVVTPVDVGHVCINYDIGDLRSRDLQPPATLDDLIDPRYRGLLVVQNPALSSPGLAFLLATVVRYGDGWTDYWQALVNNDVLVVDGWSDAYYSAFTRYGGDRPLVVSYSTSPPAEVLFADPPLPAGSPAPTGVLVDSCFEQIEFAGVLRGTRHPEAARLLVDHLVSRNFQELLPENLFVYPVRDDAELPPSFLTHAPVVRSPLRMDADTIDTRRQEWIDFWTDLVLG
ncbi:MAG: thiamine ABC transporter substrate binding subunit [Actinomycetota bacterium]